MGEGAGEVLRAGAGLCLTDRPGRGGPANRLSAVAPNDGPKNLGQEQQGREVAKGVLPGQSQENFRDPKPGRETHGPRELSAWGHKPARWPR
jgi:hypothetical protein